MVSIYQTTVNDICTLPRVCKAYKINILFNSRIRSLGRYIPTISTTRLPRLNGSPAGGIKSGRTSPDQRQSLCYMNRWICISRAIRRSRTIFTQSKMPEIFDDKSEHCIPFLLERLKAHQAQYGNDPSKTPPFFLGLNGVQGAGKTVLVN